MDTDLSDRTALVTGGGTGIGRAIALGMAGQGANVVLNYNRSEPAADEAVTEIDRIGAKAIAVKADVTRWSDVDAMFQRAQSVFGHVDILVNNAGGPIGKQATQDMPEEVWDQTIALNLKSVFLCCKAAIPQLPDGKGRIINITSISGHSGKGGPAYGPAKAGVAAMTRDMATELAPRGITVNSIAPGVIDTRFHRTSTPRREYEALIQRIPLGRDGKVQDIIGAAILLASDAGSFITGENIHINGGMLMA